MATRKKIDKTEEEILEEEIRNEEEVDEAEEVEEEEVELDEDLGTLDESQMDEPDEEMKDLPVEAVEDDLPGEQEAAAVIGKEAFQMTSDVPVQVVVVMGKKTISVKELAEMKLGQVVDLSRPVNEMVDIVAGGKLVAKGELVDIDGKMGVRVVKLVR